MNRSLAVAALLCAAVAGGCTAAAISSHDSLFAADPGAWFARQGVARPRGDLVVICHAFGCLRKSPVRFSAAEVARITAPLARRPASAAAERAAVSKAVQRFETIVGGRLGTGADLGGFERIGGGDPTQMDCIDEATNTTTLLVLLSERGLLRHHDVRHPASRGILIDGRYPHNSAVVQEKGGGERWVIDSWPRANGEPPVVQRLDLWMRERRSSIPGA